MLMCESLSDNPAWYLLHRDGICSPSYPTVQASSAIRALPRAPQLTCILASSYHHSLARSRAKVCERRWRAELSNAYCCGVLSEVLEGELPGSMALLVWTDIGNHAPSCLKASNLGTPGSWMLPADFTNRHSFGPRMPWHPSYNAARSTKYVQQLPRGRDFPTYHL
jgi:hypothetical protein